MDSPRNERCLEIQVLENRIHSASFGRRMRQTVFDHGQSHPVILRLKSGVQSKRNQSFPMFHIIARERRLHVNCYLFFHVTDHIGSVAFHYGRINTKISNKKDLEASNIHFREATPEISQRMLTLCQNKNSQLGRISLKTIIRRTSSTICFLVFPRQPYHYSIGRDSGVYHAHSHGFTPPGSVSLLLSYYEATAVPSCLIRGSGR